MTDGLGREVEALLDAARDLASTLELRPLLELLLDHLGSAVDYSGTAILVLDPSGESLKFAHMRGPASFTPELAASITYRRADFGPVWDRLARDEPIVIPDVRGQGTEAKLFRQMVGEDDIETTYSFIRAVMWVPLVVRQHIIGLLSITNPTPGAYGDREATLALAIARQAAVAMENARLHEQVRQAAASEERQRMARELHDSVTQALYGASLYAEAASRALADGEIDFAAINVRDLSDTVREALGEMRLLLFELRAPLLEERGLAAAIQARMRAVEARAGLAAEFLGEQSERLAPEMEQELFRLTQEALNNVVKHAHARRVTVLLQVSSESVRLEVSDDGVGFEPELTGGDGFGMSSMRERSEQLGGTLVVDSRPGAGTCVRIEVQRNA